VWGYVGWYVFLLELVKVCDWRNPMGFQREKLLGEGYWREGISRRLGGEILWPSVWKQLRIRRGVGNVSGGGKTS
jgi:hypothetical protein